MAMKRPYNRYDAGFATPSYQADAPSLEEINPAKLNTVSFNLTTVPFTQPIRIGDAFADAFADDFQYASVAALSASPYATGDTQGYFYTERVAALAPGLVITPEALTDQGTHESAAVQVPIYFNAPVQACAMRARARITLSGAIDYYQTHALLYLGAVEASQLAEASLSLCRSLADGLQYPALKAAGPNNTDIDRIDDLTGASVDIIAYIECLGNGSVRVRGCSAGTWAVDVTQPAGYADGIDFVYLYAARAQYGSTLVPGGLEEGIEGDVRWDVLPNVSLAEACDAFGVTLPA